MIDGLTVAQAVKCYFRMCQFEDDAAQKGWIQEFENGSNLSSEAVLYYKEVERWDKYCKNLGLHVKGRDTIKVFKADTGKTGGFLRPLADLHKKATG